MKNYLHTKEKERSGSMDNALDNSAIQTNLFTDFDYFRRSREQMQCRYCRSDYMRFQSDGLCQNCQQKAEFIFREKLSPSERLRFFRKPIPQEISL